MAELIVVHLPSLGDDDDAVVKGTVSMWLAEVGQALREGQDLLEITTDKAAFVVPAPQAGTLAEQRVNVGDVIHVGAPIATLSVL